jgi:ELWxxDGT repeat protein
VSALDDYGNHGSTGTILSFAATARTQLVKDFTPHTDSSFPSNLTALGNKLFFSALNTTYINQEEFLGRELWLSDGTPPRTGIVKDLNPGNASGDPKFLNNASGTLFFLANDSELWWSNTSDTTIMIAHIDSLDHSNSRPLEIVAVDLDIFLTIYNGAKNKYELWYSNIGQCVLLKDFDPRNVPTEELLLTDVNSTLYFTAYDDTHGLELWKSDGTTCPSGEPACFG